jgi:hypothetical protein
VSSFELPDSRFERLALLRSGVGAAAFGRDERGEIEACARERKRDSGQ